MYVQGSTENQFTDWTPCRNILQLQLQQAIEKIQHRATKLIPELRNDSYQERLSKLSLPSLVYRRQRGDLIFLYQLINQHFNIDINDFFRYQTYTIPPGAITTKSISHMQNASVV